MFSLFVFGDLIPSVGPDVGGFVLNAITAVAAIAAVAVGGYFLWLIVKCGLVGAGYMEDDEIPDSLDDGDSGGSSSAVASETGGGGGGRRYYRRNYRNYGYRRYYRRRRY